MHWLKDIRSGACEIEDYLTAWMNNYAHRYGKAGKDHLDETEKRKLTQELCDHLYGNLSIIDSKAAALIGSNAIITAILSLLAFEAGDRLSLVPYGGTLHIFLLTMLLLSLLSLIANVTVIFVYWSTSEEIGRESEVQAEQLVRVRNSRTLRYRIAFLLHGLVLSGCALLVLSIIFRILFSA